MTTDTETTTDTVVEEPTPDPAPEPAAIAVVDPEQARRAELDRHQAEAVDRVADAGMLPGSATYDEFMAMAVQARMLSMSGAAPKAIKNNPHVALHIVMIGRDLGISASAAVELIDVIETSQGLRPSLSPQLLNGQIRRLGLGSIIKVISTKTRCVAMAMGPGGRYDLRCKPLYPEHRDGQDGRATGCTCTIDKFIGEAEFTWEAAQEAELVGPECSPGEHKKVTKQRRNGNGTYQTCGCNQGYITYPDRMMWWRAAGFCADDWFPEAGMGLYMSEALGAVVDQNGRAIDVDAVTLPPGYEPETPRGSRSSGEADGFAEATDEDKSEVKRRIDALPVDGQAALKVLWRPTDDDGNYTEHALPVWHKLQRRQISRARAVVKSIEDRAIKGEWGEWSPTADPATGEVTPTDKPSESEGEPESSVKVVDAMQEVTDRVKRMSDEEVVAGLEAAGLKVQKAKSRQRLDLVSHLYAEAGGVHLGSERPADTDNTPESAGEGAESTGEGTDGSTAPDPTPEVERDIEAEISEVVDEIIERVRKMNPAEVLADLNRRELAVVDDVQINRRTLAENMVEIAEAQIRG